MAHHHLYEYIVEDIIRIVGKMGIKGTCFELELDELDLRNIVGDFISYLQSGVGSNNVSEYAEFLQKMIEESNVKHQEDVESLQKKIQDLNVEHQKYVESLLFMIQESHVVDRFIKTVERMGIDGAATELALNVLDVLTEVDNFIKYLQSGEGRSKISEFVGLLQKLIQDSHVKHHKDVESLQKRIHDRNVEHPGYVNLLRMMEGSTVEEDSDDESTVTRANKEHQEYVESLLQLIQDSNVKHQAYVEPLQNLIRLSNGDESTMNEEHHHETNVQTEKEDKYGEIMQDQIDGLVSRISLASNNNGRISSMKSNQELVLKTLTEENQEDKEVGGNDQPIQEENVLAESVASEGMSMMNDPNPNQESRAGDQGMLSTMTNPNQKLVLMTPNEDGESLAQDNNASTSEIQISVTGTTGGRMTRVTAVGKSSDGTSMMNGVVGGMPVGGRAFGRGYVIWQRRFTKENPSTQPPNPDPLPIQGPLAAYMVNIKPIKTKNVPSPRTNKK